MEPLIGWATTILMATVLLFIGFLSYRSSKKTLMDYAIAGGVLGWIAVAFNAFATNSSTYTMLGAVGTTKTMGMAYTFSTGMSMAMHLFITFIVIGGLLVANREVNGICTPFQLIGARYESRALEVFVALFSFFACSLYITVQFVACGTVLAPLLGIDFRLTSIVLAIVVLIYVLMGGMRAVAWTNIVLGLIMIFGFVIPLLLLLNIFPLPEMVSKVNPLQFSSFGLVGYTPELEVTSNIVARFAIMGWPWLYFAMMASKDLKVVRMSYPFTVFFSAVVFMTAVTIYGAVLGPSLFPEVTGRAADNIIPLMLGKYLPGWDVVYIFAILAAGLSTIATIVTLQGVSIESDVLRPLGKKLSEEGKVLCARVAAVVSVLLGFVIALGTPLQVGLIWSTVCNPVFGLLTPIILGLRWKRGTKWGAWASLITGIVLLGIGSFVDYPIFYPRPSILAFPISSIVSFLACTTVYIVVSLLTKPSPDALNRFLEQPKKWLQEH